MSAIEDKQPVTYADTGESGLPVLRCFCVHCGSPIFSAPAATPAMDWIKTGTHDDVSWLQSQLPVWCDSEQHWLKPDIEVPYLPENPTLTWPDEGSARS